MAITPTIEVDHREGHSRLFQTLSGNPVFAVCVTHLKCGDVKIGKVIVEIKRRFDFFLSLDDGRSYTQLYNPRRKSERVVLLLVDPFWLRANIGPWIKRLPAS